MPEVNTVIDIKPKWKEEIEKNKLSQGRVEYQKRGYKFEILYTDKIKVSYSRFKDMVKNKIVWLYPSAVKRFEKRFKL